MKTPNSIIFVEEIGIFLVKPNENVYNTDSTESASQDSLKMTWTCIGSVLNKTYMIG